MLDLFGEFTNDALVAGDLRKGRCEVVIHCGHVLALVVGAAIANHNLRRVLVRHHNVRRGEARAERVRLILLKGLFAHARVQVGPHLEDVRGEGGHFGTALFGEVDGLHVRVVEAQTHQLAVFH